MAKSLKIAVIGQSVFAKDVYNLIKKNGHTIVGVFTIPDKNGREVGIIGIIMRHNFAFWGSLNSPRQKSREPSESTL